jgi:hypothetical protein
MVVEDGLDEPCVICGKHPATCECEVCGARICVYCVKDNCNVTLCRDC